MDTKQMYQGEAKVPNMVRILQQWWEQGMTMNMGFGEVSLFDPKGEWRDVPLEKEE
jgi:hypothetical protein